MVASRLIRTLSVARSGVYFLEALPLGLASRFFTNPNLPPPTEEQVRVLWKHILRLIDLDVDHLENNVYDWRVLDRETPWRHLRSYLGVMSDGVKVALRMKSGTTKSFDRNVDQTGLPDYYCRNFHFQTDGYLSEASARRYDHQVDLLFSGTAGAMRRLILPVLKNGTSGEGRWLELGSGTGSATRAVLSTFPRVRVTGLDLSAPYLKVAQENLRRFSKADFVQGDATSLPFKEKAFDAVYSVFVLHELPAVERERLVREAYRVLKPGGLLVLADALQMNDEPELNWALERFPKVYHEPFFKNYVTHKMERLLERVTGIEASSSHAFFTKVAWVQKP